jgi:hypothetical protein
MRYAFVKDNLVKESNRPLPIVWENISNFHLLDADTLKSFGWFPYRFVIATLNENEIVDGTYFSIENDEVIEYQNKRVLTDNEILQNYESMWVHIRYRRNIELTDCDWTQLSDSPLSDELREEWKIYRQSLRDITLQEDPFNIVWPIKPGTINE